MQKYVIFNDRVHHFYIISEPLCINGGKWNEHNKTQNNVLFHKREYIHLVLYMSMVDNRMKITKL